MDQKILNLQARVAEASVRLGPDEGKTNRIVLVLENLSNKAVELGFGQQGEISLTLRIGKSGEDLVATSTEALGILTETPKGGRSSGVRSSEIDSSSSSFSLTPSFKRRRRKSPSAILNV